MKQPPLFVLSIILIIQHLVFERWLKPYRVTREVIRTITILGWSYPVALEKYGAYGEKIWRIIATGFAAAGLIQMGLTMMEANRVNKERKIFRGGYSSG